VSKQGNHIDPSPPRFILRFFKWFCHPDLHTYIEGDLMEIYKERVEVKGKMKADWRFMLDVLLLFRPDIIRPFEGYHQLNYYGMFKHYIKVSWRNLLKNKGYSIINISGLGVGMAVALFIGLWIHYEASVDSFHQNIDRIGIIRKHTLFNETKETQLSVPLPLYEALSRNFPEIKHISRSKSFTMSLMAKEQKVRQTGQFVDPDFLGIFSFPLIKGDIETALIDPKSIVLTESLAEILFGNDDPIGKLVRVNNAFEVQVTGVMKDVPDNSFFNDITFLAPLEFMLTNSYLQRYRDNWGSNVIWTFLEVNEGVSMDAFSEKISFINRENDPNSKEQKLSVQPFGQFHLYGEYENWKNVGGKIAYLRLFGIIGIFVLLIACINFMNLSTARSEKRAREVGIRKAIGSLRTQLILQFFSESVMISFIAFLLSIGLVFVGLPYLRNLGFEFIELEFSNRLLWMIGFGICLITGLIAGSYPAFYLSSFQPVKILKGTFTQGWGPVIFRKLLVVFQFTISVALIIGALVVFHQIKHGKDRHIGYNPNNLISIQGSEDIAKNFGVMKQELLNTGYLEAVTRTSSPMTEVYNKWSDFSWENKDPNSRIALEALMTGWDYEKAAGLTFIQGRPFSPEFSTDSNAVILNETALDIIGYKDPIGRTMTSGSREITIVGVVKDVLMQDPFEPVAPGVIMFVPDIANNILVRIKSGVGVQETLATIRPIFEAYNPAFPFEYSFVDEEYNKKFSIENQVGKLASIFAVLAIFISALGLFGLVAYLAEKRTKEIGIRKILGASVISLWGMLSKDLLGLVLIACFIAIPIAFYLMEGWLQQYDYRIELSWWIFAISSLLIVTITLLTVSFQSIKAALSNPVDSLKSE